MQQPELVQVIQKHLTPGGMLFMQGDIIEVRQILDCYNQSTANALPCSIPHLIFTALNVHPVRSVYVL
jgi:hypothetical protein